MMLPYYKFDSCEEVQTVLKKIRDLHREICIGIAKSEKQLFISKGNVDEENKRLITYVSPKTWDDPRISADYSEDLANLSTSELKEFFEAYRSHYFNSSFIPLRSHRGPYDFTKSFNKEDTCPHTNADFFSKLLLELERLPFMEIGRVFLIYTPPLQKEIWHIDYWPGEFYDGTKHFMWISSNKSLLMNINEKIESVESEAMMFNFSHPHSTPESRESCYSIRIEGQFNQDFCKRNNIAWKAR